MSKNYSKGLIIGSVNLALLIISSCQPSIKQADSKLDSSIIFKDSAGNTLTEKDLMNSTGVVNYEIADNRSVNPVAKKLHQEATELGHQGRYDSAIAKLQQAIKIQPTWAYSFYDLAYTYLLKGDLDSALKFYRRTDELEPKGFFTAKTALYALEGEKAGNWPKGTYNAYVQLEWIDNEAEKSKVVKTMTEKIPDFVPAWKELANLSDNRDEKLKAIEKGLSKEPDLETKGILLINKAILFNEIGKKEEALQLLGNLIFLPESTKATVELAKFTLKSIIEK